MRITFRNGIYVAIATYEERESLREAGFIWHEGLNQCERGPRACAACRAGLQKGWWTRKNAAAARLSAYADDAASKALASHLQAVELSRATDSEAIIPAPPKFEYLGYQKAGIQYMAKREGTLLGDEPGLGKTIQVLGFVNHTRAIENVLVICPAPLRINWKKEAQKWLVPDDRRWLLYIASDDQPVPAKANFVITNYERCRIGFKKCEGLCKGKRREPIKCPKCKGTGDGPRHPLLCEMCKGSKTIFCPTCNGKGRVASRNIKIINSLAKREWDLVAVDEAHFLKNPDSGRTRAILGDRIHRKSGLADLGKRRVFMTGTPIPNRPIEIWPILSALAPDEFGNFKTFAKRYCDGHEEYISETKKVFKFDGASNLEELQERLRSTCMIRRLKQDVLKELPPKRRQIISLPPSEEAKRLIAQELEEWDRKFGEDLSVVEEAMNIAEENKDKGAYTSAVDRLQYIQRVAFVEMAAMRKRVALVKIPSIIEHIKSMREEGVRKIILFAHHHDVIETLYEKFSKVAVVAYGKTSDKAKNLAVERFQDMGSGVEIFIGGLTAVGVGITLTASSNVVCAELDWTPGVMGQAEDRAHRIGQANSVLIQHLVLDGSLDARMAQMIVEKQNIADRALDRSTDVAVKGLFNERPEAPVEPIELWKKIVLKEALIALAKRRDPSIEGGSGFSQFDAPIGQKLATKNGEFSDKEGHLALKLVQRYRGQVPLELLKRLNIDVTPPKPERRRRLSRQERLPLMEQENAITILERLG